MKACRIRAGQIPGGVVLGPALIFTAFILGQALFEKLTGTGPKGKKK